MTITEAVRRLTEERLALGLSLRDVVVAQTNGLTRSAGLSLATLSRYERGTTEPDFHHLEAWAGALGYDLVVELRPRPGKAALEASHGRP